MRIPGYLVGTSDAGAMKSCRARVAQLKLGATAAAAFGTDEFVELDAQGVIFLQRVTMRPPPFQHAFCYCLAKAMMDRFGAASAADDERWRQFMEWAIKEPW